MKKGYFWIIVLVCISICVSATADAYILHTPTSEQIQEDEATQIALDFIKSMTGIELTGLFRVEDSRKVEGKVESSFGPGYQWYADTQDDCWALTLRNEIVLYAPFVVVHGTTGEVVYWEYTDNSKEPLITYLNMLPNEEQITFGEAVQLAEREVFEVFPSLSQEEKSVQGAFGLATDWDSAYRQFDAVPAWLIYLTYDNPERTHLGSFVIDAKSSAILDKSVYSMQEVKHIYE